jgi:hypothetical protein
MIAYSRPVSEAPYREPPRPDPYLAVWTAYRRAHRRLRTARIFLVLASVAVPVLHLARVPFLLLVFAAAAGRLSIGCFLPCPRCGKDFYEGKHWQRPSARCTHCRLPFGTLERDAAARGSGSGER